MLVEWQIRRELDSENTDVIWFSNVSSTRYRARKDNKEKGKRRTRKERKGKKISFVRLLAAPAYNVPRQDRSWWLGQLKPRIRAWERCTCMGLYPTFVVDTTWYLCASETKHHNEMRHRNECLLFGQTMWSNVWESFSVHRHYIVGHKNVRLLFVYDNFRKCRLDQFQHVGLLLSLFHR